MWLTRLALRNPILILMLSLGVTVLGLVSARRLPVDLFPNITMPVLRVVTFYPGAAPRDIEKSITYPIEKAVSAVSDIDHVESTSKQGASVVSLYLNFGANLDTAEIEVIQRVQAIVNQLPPGVQQPFVAATATVKIDPTMLPSTLIGTHGLSSFTRHPLREFVSHRSWEEGI